jgi:ubiquinone biosynthesis protein
VQPTTRRAAEVAAVLMHHGLGSLVDVLDGFMLLPGIHHPPAGSPKVTPVHLRRALEELGPAFVKLGQVLSTRPDLVPPDFEAELSKLQDAAPPVPHDEIVAVAEKELGCSITAAFAHFDPTPIAAASIGQVHAATLANGADVVVKIRRPNVVEQVQLDLALLERLAHVAERRSAIARRYDVTGLAREFDVTLTGELDYQGEANNARVLADAFIDNPGVHIPRIFDEHTCEGVITEERIRGTKIDDLATLDTHGIDRVATARHFADAYLSMVFVRRFFHADPHPGNVFVENDGRVAFVDFGMVGSVSDATGRGLGSILLAVVGCDAAQMTDGFLSLGVANEGLDRAALEHDLSLLLAQYAGHPLQEIQVGPLLSHVMAIVRAHHLRMPTDLALLLKTVMMCEGVAVQLDPSFELVPQLIPYAAAFSQPA